MKQKWNQGERYAFKSLGQHFLQNEEIAFRIADCLPRNIDVNTVLEVGPGPGILSRQLYKLYSSKLNLIELDKRFFLDRKAEFPLIEHQIFNEDLLKFDLQKVDSPVAIIGNFPYNISSQILFYTLDNKEIVPCIAGMFQKEMALRVVAPPGKKDYGILSVLIQVFYEADYLFDVGPHEFNPPPKVDSAVILLKRRDKALIPEEHYRKFALVVKTAFNQRRKTLKNSLSSITTSYSEDIAHFLQKRPEQIGIIDFYSLTRSIYSL